jgi:hypothetical protein
MQTQSKLFGVIFIPKTRLKSLTKRVPKHVATVFQKEIKEKYIFFFSLEKGF